MNGTVRCSRPAAALSAAFSPQPAAAAPKTQVAEAPAKVAVQLPTHFKPVVLEEPEKARCVPRALPDQPCH
jgi:hypothetical protein